jgi:hypothetical protein
MEGDTAGQDPDRERDPRAVFDQDKEIDRQGDAQDQQSHIASELPGGLEGQQEADEDQDRPGQADDEPGLGHEGRNEGKEVIEPGEMGRPGEEVGKGHDAEADLAEHRFILIKPNVSGHKSTKKKKQEKGHTQ